MGVWKALHFVSVWRKRRNKVKALQRRERMKMKAVITVAALALAIAAPSITEGKDKKKPSPRGMIESMQSIPCGVNQRGLAGLGSVFGSVGVTHVNSNEKLCPQYLFRTDDMDYHIRPADTKHDVILPIGHEAEFKIKKDRLFLKVPDGDRKVRAYQVVAMESVNSSDKKDKDSAAYRPGVRPTESRPMDTRPEEKQRDSEDGPPRR